MTSKERVRTSVAHKLPDKVPANFECVSFVMNKLLNHYRFNDPELILKKFDIDFRYVEPQYTGPKLHEYREGNDKIKESFWGFKSRCHWTGREYNEITCYHPLDGMSTVKELNTFPWPSPDWFDYESIKRKCDKYKDNAIIIGHEGPFQIACDLISMEKLFMDMVVNPEFAHGIFDRMVAFELEFYERIFMAANGGIDILRPHDDYGTQLNLFFSVDMWKDYFMENTKKLVSLAHKYGSFYMQHSCGAVRLIIPEFIKCGIDILEPIQKVNGMEPEALKRDFGDMLAFHGGIDTQGLLPFGTPEEVKAETRYYIDTLGAGGGYILMASQGFEGDVPIENIEAMYSIRDES